MTLELNSCQTQELVVPITNERNERTSGIRVSIASKLKVRSSFSLLTMQFEVSNPSPYPERNRADGPRLSSQATNFLFVALFSVALSSRGTSTKMLLSTAVATLPERQVTWTRVDCNYRYFWVAMLK